MPPWAIALAVLISCPMVASAAPMRAQLASTPGDRAVAVSGATPVLETPSAMSLRAGLVADQALHASDADGDPVTFSLVSGPPYMTVTTVDPGAGSALGNVHLAPGIADVGSVTSWVAASDDFSTTHRPLNIVVYALLNRPADMVVDEGATADQAVSVFDPEGGRYEFSLVAGPSFVTVTTTSDSTGNVHLAPGFADAGSYWATVSVTDGALTDSKIFQITVNNVNFPPVLAQPADMRAVSGIGTDQSLIASDPDNDALTFLKVAGPTYMYVGPGYVHLYPTNADLGTTTATVAVSDGRLSDQKSFAIQVVLTDADPVLAAPEDMQVMEGEDQDQIVSASDPDGQALFFDAWSRPRFMLVTKLPQSYGSTTALGRIRLMPTYADSGRYTPTLVVSDGKYQDTKRFNITVRDAYPGENSFRLDVSAPAGAPNPPANEYSSVDGSFTARLDPGGLFLAFDFRESSGHGAVWSVEFKAPYWEVLKEGRYENAVLGTWGGALALRVFGSDPDVPSLSGCTNGTASVTIHRLVQRADGSLLSFSATFDAVCADSSASFHGEVRYQVQAVPITLVAPRWVLMNAGETRWFEISAVDTLRDAIVISATGVPPGASFIDLGYGVGRLGWIPSPSQQGDYPVRFTALSANGLADTLLTTIRVGIANHSPAARANGPYEGTVGVPIPFTAAGTTDLDGDSLSYLWTFGDGTTGNGPAPLHAYSSVGPYPVSLTVSDGLFSSGDPTLATISQPRTGRAFLANGEGPLRLEAGSAKFCVTMQVVAVLRGREDVSGMQMRVAGWGDTGVIAADSESIVVGEPDPNGVSDITVCFSRGALRELFANVTGRVSADAMLDASLRDGHGWNAPLQIDVIGPGPELAVLVAPNPLNPVGTLTFVTQRAGLARLRLFDVRGRLVRTLLQAAFLAPGYHDVMIDGQAADGAPLPSGVYYYRLETAEGNREGRIAIVK